MVDDDIVEDALQIIRWRSNPPETSKDIQVYLRFKYKDVLTLIISSAERVVAAMEPEPGLGGRKLDAHSWLDNFTAHWHQLKTSAETPKVRIAGFAAVEAAFVLGCLVGESGGGDEMRKRLKATLTKRATETRMITDIKNLIWRRTIDHWKFHPDHRSKPQDTAIAISDDVFQDLRTLKAVPRQWKTRKGIVGRITNWVRKAPGYIPSRKSKRIT